MADMKWSPEDWARLGVQIRKAREERGYSRKKLSELSGISEKSIQLTEEGRVPTRWPKSLHALEDALGWSSPASVLNVLSGDEPIYVPKSIENPYAQPDLTSRDDIEVDIDRLRSSIGNSEGPVLGMAGSMLPRLGSARDVKLTTSAHLAQDVFIRQAKRYRLLRGLSIGQLATKLAGKEPILEEDDIARLENGTRSLRMAEADAIATALETTVDWLLGSGFSSDAPEEMKRPPNDKELEAEANAVLRRIGEVGAQLNAAHQHAAAAQAREEAARTEARMAMTMVQSVVAQQAEMARHYQYILGRIDSIRAARGEETAIQIVPVYEGDEKRAREDDLEDPPFTE